MLPKKLYPARPVKMHYVSPTQRESHRPSPSRAFEHCARLGIAIHFGQGSAMALLADSVQDLAASRLELVGAGELTLIGLHRGDGSASHLRRHEAAASQ